MVSSHDKNISTKVICVFLYFVLLFCVLLSSQKSYFELGIFSIIILFVSIVLLLLSTKCKIVSFPVVFSVLTWVFHYGYFPLYIFGAESNIWVNDLLKYSFLDVQRAFGVCTLFYVIMNIGLVCVVYPNQAKIINGKKPCLFSKSFIRGVRILWLILLIPFLIYTFYLLKLQGYSAVRANTVSGFLSYIFLLFYALSIFLFYDSSLKKKYIWMLLLIAVFALQIFTGQRFDAVCIEIVFIVIAFSNIRFRIITIIAIAAFGFLGMYAITTVGKYRFDNSLMFSMLFKLENFESFIKSNPLLTTIGDFGGTLTSVISPVKNLDPSNYLYGGTYFASLLRVIPSLHKLFPEELSYFTYLLPANEQTNLGGSFLGEAFANFGYAGFIIMFFYGCFVAFIYNLSERERTTSALWYCWCFICFLQLLNLVRGYNHNIIFMPVWTFIIFKFLNANELAKRTEARSLC